MIVHLFNLNDSARKREELKEHALQEKLTLQPKIFVIGENWNNLTEIFVVLNDITYEVKTVLRAVDVVVKIRFIFNLEYSSKSKYVWVLYKSIFTKFRQ